MGNDVLLDVNVLVALVWPQHLHHARAHAWLAQHRARFATTPLTEAALVRLSLKRSVTDTDIAPAEALALLTGVRAHPQHLFVPDDSTLADPVISLRRFATTRQVTDLHLVNLCAVHGLVLLTLDRAVPEMIEPDDRRFVSVLEGAR